MTNAKVNITTKCEECGAPADESFAFGHGLHYFCPKHEEIVFTKVTGKPLKLANSDSRK